MKHRMTPAHNGFGSVGPSGYSANRKRSGGRGARSGLQTCARATEESEEGCMQEMEDGYNPSSVVDWYAWIIDWRWVYCPSVHPPP
ncbi:hypothetical protein CVT25_013666 [Psilocybe cyanescens]|uniref:Uncharacterized protein n=1 Tax=Psilocybe cyanescens TaxID=93625 RepID=A0A409WTG0_PSICY|nr:hypothetical protein CVT25_013666 [Psilocybe cyanescens]